MQTLVFTTKLVLGALILASNGFYILCLIAAFKFFRRRQNTIENGPPATILVPLHGEDFRAYECYAALCLQKYGNYQIVFGVSDERDAAAPIVRALIEDFPDREIDLAVSRRRIGDNLKVSNLDNMLARAKHEYLVIVDSDIKVGEDYLRSVISPLLEENVGLVTCLYKAAGCRGFVSTLEAVGLTAEFAPGVLSAWLLEGMTFALGSTMALTKTQLESIGGFRRLSSYLADDFMLGNLVAAQGRQVRLSNYVVETTLEPCGFLAMFKHQLRWARSTRISRPLGYLGLIMTYGTPLALAYLTLDLGSKAGWLMLAATLCVRLAMGWLIGVHWLRDRVLRKYFWLLPVRDLMSLVVWFLGLIGRRVEWRGRRFEVLRDGQIVEVRDLRSEAPV